MCVGGCGYGCVCGGRLVMVLVIVWMCVGEVL